MSKKMIIDIEDEFRRAEVLLTAAAELNGGDGDERDLSFELLDKVLIRLRQVKNAYENGEVRYA